MKLDDTFNELQNCQDDIPIFRKLISTTSLHDPCTGKSVKECQKILTYIIEIVSSNSELGNERVLLACHAFYALLSTHCDPLCLKDTVMHFQKLDSHDLCFLERWYTVSDLKLFKLLNAYGYLLTNRKKMHLEYDAFLLMFDVIFENCMKYTRYSYFAYKVLYVWLKKLKQITDMRFWYKDNCILERKLEAIIFSNWSNALNDICKQNAQIFNMYLRIMSMKYTESYTSYILSDCILNIPWQNEIKYIILTEIYQVWDIAGATINKHLYDLCISLTKNSLRPASTKLYLTILRKVSEDEWKKSFGEIMKLIINRWDSGEHEDHNALQSLFKYWLEPTIEKHRNILLFLWKLCGDLQGYFFRSHLQRMAAKLRIELPGTHEMDHYTNNKEEIVRLNAFVVLCYRAADMIDVKNEVDPFFQLKQFLWFNANAATIFMREGIMKYFKILCSNVLKVISIKAVDVRSISEFMEWLHEYFLDCFEIGSCYQRKILALNLYKILLSFTNGNSHDSCAHHRECLRYITAIDKHLKTTNSWKFTDKDSLFLLLRLVLDSALDVRQLATTLILEYFEKDILSVTEKRILYNCAWEHCNSSKFYKIESGAALVKIMAHWLPLNEHHEDVDSTFSHSEYNNILAYSSYSEFLLYEAQCQLAQMKCDILKAIVQNRPFYGVLTALLSITFRAGPENWILTLQFTEEMLNLLKEATNFFLSMFTKASDTVYSSSFAEMGLAIDEKIKTSEIETSNNYDELQLSPAHQVLISCIWMSLKVSCEIVSEIGMLMQSNAQVKDSMDIIVTVLLKCRHKGVVESAGVAIANLARRLYGRKEYSELPRTYLASLLEKENAEKLLYLTRRGAGLSIMFHRLVVSDNRRDRPTVHFAVQMLLRSLKDFSMTAVREVEPGQDSPWAKRLYFLRTLVVDKEMHAQLVPYMEDICLTCFEYMKSDVWTVRNASLQLYGAVVPRLVGQCSGRSLDEELDFGYGYSVNHFVTHYPTLASRMFTQLRDVSKIRGTSNAALRSYSSVAYILVLLSKLSTSGCYLDDYPAAIVFITKVKLLLLCSFLGNPMMYIRQLAAKVYTAFTPVKNICETDDAIAKVTICQDINMSHGYLLTYRYLLKKLIYNFKDTQHFFAENYMGNGSYWKYQYAFISEIWNNMYEQKEAAQPCYVLETLFLQESPLLSPMSLFYKELYFEPSLPIIECIVSSQKIQPGFFQYIGYRTRLYAMHLKLHVEFDWPAIFDNPDERQMIHDILNSNCAEQCIEFLNGLSHCVYLLEFILKYLISMSNNNRHQLLFDETVTFTLNTIKHASLKSNELEFDKVIEELNETTDSSMIRVRNSLILAFSKSETLINQTLLYVFNVCMNEKQSVRLTAAEHIELTLYRYVELGNSNRLTIKRCCLILLKDEIPEIREIVSTALQRQRMFEHVVDSTICHVQHEEIAYQQLLSDVIRLESIADDDVDFIRYFTRAVHKNVDFNATIENPFKHDDSSFYREESKFLNMCFFLYDASNDNHDDHLDATYAIQARHFRKLREKAGFRYDDLQVVLYLKDMEYLARKRDIVVQQRELFSSIRASHLKS
ncbi:uncharacterized protein [Anoplolepis gracilipes]|uniref:uncharacterized protein n=1 Tax=Anoplolepis gracilipes TaxID=354296 RepID=UPI003B9FD470